MLCEGKPTFGHWLKAEKRLHINCLEMLAVCQAWQFFLPDLKGHHVLIHSDNMSVVSYINHQGGLSSKRLCLLAECLLEWAQPHLRSLRVLHIPGKLNQGADKLSRSNVPSDEWMLHPQVIRWIKKWGHPVLLVAPLWKNQPWLSELTQLLKAAPFLWDGTSCLKRTGQFGTLCPICGPCTFGHLLVVCLLQRSVRRPAGPRHPHLLGFITWTYWPYRPGSSLLNGTFMHGNFLTENPWPHGAQALWLVTCKFRPRVSKCKKLWNDYPGLAQPLWV